MRLRRKGQQETSALADQKEGMMTVKTLGVCLILCALVFFSGVTTTQASDTYEEMITAIEAWLQSHPKREFSNPSAEQVFRWKVQLEKARYNSFEKFVVLSSLLSEIGTTRFTYEYYIYDVTSVRAKMLDIYPLAYHQNRQKMPAPEQFIRESYLWFKNNVTSIQEQAYWLQLFLSCIGRFRLDEDDIAQIVSNEMKMIHELIVQYLGLAHYYLEQHRDEIIHIDDVYKTVTTVATTQEKLDIILRPLAEFCESVGSYLSPEDRKLILDFVVPQYAENDLAVKIYAALTKP